MGGMGSFARGKKSQNSCNCSTTTARFFFPWHGVAMVQAGPRGKKNWRHCTMNAMPDKAILSTPQEPQSARENGLLFASLSLHSRATAEAVARLQCRNDFPGASLRRGTGKPTNCPLARALPLDPTRGLCPL